jgi:hypothetical protein
LTIPPVSVSLPAEPAVTVTVAVDVARPSLAVIVMTARPLAVRDAAIVIIRADPLPAR